MEARYRDIFQSLENDENKPPMEKNSRVLIVDGTNCFIRTWSIMPNMNEIGDHVGGAVGTLQSIGVAIRKIKPSRVIVVFDGKDGSYKRKKAFSGYKSNREGSNKIRVNRQYEGLITDEDEREGMKRQFVWLNDIMNHLPLTTMIYDGIEADDVIAHVSRQLLINGEESVIMSVDQDFLQLVDDTTKVWSPIRKVLYDRPILENEFGILAENFLMFKTLKGDTADAIPGVGGIGLKTLKKRIPEFSTEILTYDRLYDLCESQRTKVKALDRILNSKDKIKMNYKLMQLSEPDISGQQRLKILSRFDQKINPINKVNFHKILSKYKMENNFGNSIDWLNRTFGGLITD